MIRATKAQRFELIGGFITVFAVMALIGAVASIASGDPGVLPSLVLLGCVVALGLVYRGYRKAVRSDGPDQPPR